MQAEIGPQLHIDYELYTAARDGNINVLNELLTLQQGQHDGITIDIEDPAKRPISLSAVTYNRETALHVAASFGHIEAVTKICSQNRNLLMAVNRKLETPLHYAAEAGKGEVVSYFIQFAEELRQSQNPFHPDVRMELLRWRNRDGETALYQAVRNKHIAVVKMLIRADSRLPNIPTDSHLPSMADNNNASPLYLAALQNSHEIVGKLIESLNGDVSPKSYAGPHGQTALHAAARNKNKGILQSILEWKPELANTVDATGSTPLHFAAAIHGTDIRVLLEKDKYSAYIADSSGLFPVHVAAIMGNLEAVNQLMEICPDSDQLLDAQGRNFVHVAVEKRMVNVVWWVCNNTRLVRAMNANDDEGNTPLHLAVKSKDVKIFAHLIACTKVYVCAMNKKGLTPLDLARAQLTVGLSNWRNSERIIFRTLEVIGSCDGIYRFDRFLQECKLEWDEEKIMKEAENYENIAKNISIGSVLIASASFSGALTVFQAYRTDILANKNLPHLPGLSLAFKAFVVVVVYAFVCSITAMALHIKAASTYIDLKYRVRNIITCMNLVKMAIRGFIAAFAVGAYVILTPVSKRLAIGVCLTSIVVPVFIDPQNWPNIIVARALLRSIGWKEFRRIRSTMYANDFRPIRSTIIHWEWRMFFWNSVISGLIVLLVLVGSLINIILLQNIVLLLVIVLAFSTLMTIFMPSPIIYFMNIVINVIVNLYSFVKH